MENKIKSAIGYLGTNWVLSKISTYDPKKREPSGICSALRPVVMKAIKEKRI